MVECEMANTEVYCDVLDLLESSILFEAAYMLGRSLEIRSHVIQVLLQQAP